MKIDLTAGPAWPSAVPSITPDSAGRDQGARLRHRGPSAAGATFSGAAARARARTQLERRSRRRSCVYVQAAKVTVAGNPPTTAYTLDGSASRTSRSTRTAR